VTFWSRVRIGKPSLISTQRRFFVGVGPVNYQAFTNDSLTVMYEAIRGALAADDARMGFVFARRGIIPEACSSWFLPRVVGINQAMEWVATGRVFSAQEALAGGLVRSLHAKDELLDAARAKPGELTIASVGPNTTQHIGIERLKRLAHADLTYVPYPGGATMTNALLGNHVSAAVLNWSEIGQQINAGSARALATMAAQHIEPLPDLPTVAESGFPGFETDVWFGVVAPARTPKNVTAQLIDWFRTAVTAPQIKAKLADLALYTNPKCGADFDAHIHRQYELYTQAIHDIGIKAE